MNSARPPAAGATAARALRAAPLGVVAATGFAGGLCVLIGVAQSGSPFVLKLPGAWFFGTGPGPVGSGPHRDATFLAAMVVYAGIALLVGSWFETVRTLRRHPGTPPRRVAGILALWAAPVLVMPPLFSRDAYDYAAQGEMVARGINPYLHGPSALGRGPFLRFVDPLWVKAPAPYGPAWERLSQWTVQLAGHDVLASLAGLRIVALAGVALLAWGVTDLARSEGRDRSAVLALAALNPLVLLVLLGGAHNDALMLGLLVAGCALARRDHFVLGLVACGLAAEIKVPALIGAAFIGWWWAGAPAGRRARARRVVGAVLVAAGIMAAVGALCGLGWGWLRGLSNPGVVVSWLDPATAAGLALARLAGLVGLGGHTAGFVQVTRAAGLGVAAVVAVGLLWRAERLGVLRALGWSLLVLAVLGPVVWPWYEAWGFVVLAVVAEGWTLRVVLALSAVACFADVPGLAAFGAPDPALALAGWGCLITLVAVFCVVRLAPSLAGRARSPSGAVMA